MRKSLLTLMFAGILTVSVTAANITMKGSDTMVRLGQRWAEEYMKKNPGSVIQVSGGGSGTGIAALFNGTTDICMASRDMKPKEYADAKAKNLGVARIAVALDGIAIFLNKENPVADLSISQLRAIYTGELTNWKEVGGPDATIILYGRENNSGTYAYFKEHVLQEDDFADRCQTLPGTASVVNALTKDTKGIGYGGIAWATTVKHAGVKSTDTSKAVHPTMEAVSSGEYPISRELYFFLRGEPTVEVKNFINWALSPEGQKVAESADYIPLKAEAAKANVLK
ncbi:MAG: phosphate ABC transporter substrate-binding protein [bacterium]|nr:phosphate ABC transporter substrate-binding protein [bacterium]